MIITLFLACSVSFLDPVTPALVAEPTPPVVPLDPVSKAKANNLTEVANATGAKLTREYEDSIVNRAQDSSLVFRSGSATGMFEVSGMPAGTFMTVLQDGWPLWSSYRPQGDMTLGEPSLSPLPGRSEKDGGLTMFGKNHLGHDNGNLVNEFVITLDVNNELAGYSSFRGWSTIEIVRDPNAPGPGYILAAPGDRAFMFIGFPQGAEFQIGEVTRLNVPAGGDGVQVYELDRASFRTCMVPTSDRHTSMTWSSCPSTF